MCPRLAKYVADMIRSKFKPIGQDQMVQSIAIVIPWKINDLD